MPQAILLFNTDDPEEERQLKSFFDIDKHQSALFDLSEWLRSKLKYEDLDEPVREAYQGTRDELYNLLEQYKVDID